MKTATNNQIEEFLSNCETSYDQYNNEAKLITDYGEQIATLKQCGEFKIDAKIYIDEDNEVAFTETQIEMARTMVFNENKREFEDAAYNTYDQREHGLYAFGY